MTTISHHNKLQPVQRTLLVKQGTTNWWLTFSIDQKKLGLNYYYSTSGLNNAVVSIWFNELSAETDLKILLRGNPESFELNATSLKSFLLNS